MREVRIRPRAVRDLEEIWLYTLEHWGAVHADAYLRSLDSSLQLLAENPVRGRAMDVVRPGYRSLRVVRHLVLYTFDANSISVRRVLHDQMDLPRHFDDGR